MLASAIVYKEFVRPIVDRLDPERLHSGVRQALHLAEMSPAALRLLEKCFTHDGKRFEHPSLEVNLGGIELQNPLLVGAGWTKDGHAVKALWQLGFAGVEVGSVLAFPQDGKLKPRQFSLSPDVTLNRMGFPSLGMVEVAKILKRYKNSGIPIGINISKNKDIPNECAPAVYAAVVEWLYDFASYLVINPSSPNTEGLRKLLAKGPLTDILQAVNGVMDRRGKRKPTFVKASPDSTYEEFDETIDVVIANKLTGIIATNTTDNSDIKAQYGEMWRNEPGGVSGNTPLYQELVLEKIRHAFKYAGDQIEIIASGGLGTTDEGLIRAAHAGAKAFELVTSIKSEGLCVADKRNRGLVKYMERMGVKNISEIVGQKP